MEIHKNLFASKKKYYLDQNEMPSQSANTILIHMSDKQLILPMNKVISTNNKETDHSIKAMEK